MITRILLVILLAPIVAFVLYYGVIVYQMKLGCRNLLEVAADEDRIRYLREWLNDNIKRGRMPSELNKVVRKRVIGFSPAIENLNLDFKRLGVKPEFGGMRLNRNACKTCEFPNNINSFEVFEGRDSLAVRQIGSKHLQVPDNYGRILRSVKVGENALVICRESR